MNALLCGCLYFFWPLVHDISCVIIIFYSLSYPVPTIPSIAFLWLFICIYTYGLHIYTHTHIYIGFPGGASGKEPACQCRRGKRLGVQSLEREGPWRRAWQPTPVLLTGEYHGQGSLGGYRPGGSQRVRHPWNGLASTHIYVCIYVGI